MTPTSGLESRHKTSIRAFCFTGGWETTEKASEVLHSTLQQKTLKNIFSKLSPRGETQIFFSLRKNTSKAEPIHLDENNQPHGCIISKVR